MFQLSFSVLSWGGKSEKLSDRHTKIFRIFRRISKNNQLWFKIDWKVLRLQQILIQSANM